MREPDAKNKQSKHIASKNVTLSFGCNKLYLFLLKANIAST